MNEQLFSSLLSSNDCHLKVMSAIKEVKGKRTCIVARVASVGIDTFSWKACAQGHGVAAFCYSACSQGSA